MSHSDINRQSTPMSILHHWNSCAVKLPHVPSGYPQGQRLRSAQVTLVFRLPLISISSMVNFDTHPAMPILVVANSYFFGWIKCDCPLYGWIQIGSGVTAARRVTQSCDVKSWALSTPPPQGYKVNTILLPPVCCCWVALTNSFTANLWIGKTRFFFPWAASVWSSVLTWLATAAWHQVVLW